MVLENRTATLKTISPDWGFVCFKVHIFWEGHTILRSHPLTFANSTHSQSKGKISQNYVAFLEYMNFTTQSNLEGTKFFSLDYF